ncbi:MAG TPA: DAK2 domain-containing protein, partial [Feifaniaceae bacterium]|nr:DAK2 domain-containing protein [Feifaniaceae bacterium]
MRTIPLKQWQAAIAAACDSIVESEPLLTKIDCLIGDGDHGTGMRDGFTVLKETLLSNEYPDIYALMREAGIALVKTMGGASGVIFGTLFIAGHEGVRGRADMDADALIAFFDAGGASIAKRGRTAPGDKTMLDALLPAVEFMRRKREETDDAALVLRAAYE